MSIHGAYAPNTKSTYAAGTLCFTQFCDTWGIDEEAWVLASYPLICAFIGEHKGRQAGSTICSWLSGLHAWHTVNHAPWFGDDEWVQLACIYANKEGTKHKRPLCAPVSIEHLLALHRTLNLSVSFHAAIWALALCAFFSCCRLGELAVTTAAAFDEKYNVFRSALCATFFSYISFLSFYRITFRTLRDGSRSGNFHIPWTKTTKELGASVILTGCNNILCPVAALKNHLSVNSSTNMPTSLFSYSIHKNRQLISRKWRKASYAHLQMNIRCIGCKKMLGETCFACQVGPLMALVSDSELWQKELVIHWHFLWILNSP
jgi:hypothetical protein